MGFVDIDTHARPASVFLSHVPLVMRVQGSPRIQQVVLLRSRCLLFIFRVLVVLVPAVMLHQPSPANKPGCQGASLSGRDALFGREDMVCFGNRENGRERAKKVERQNADAAFPSFALLHDTGLGL